MPGDFRVLNRHKKGARKARREALGLPDPEPTPPKNPKKKPKKLPKHRRQQPSVAKGHVCHERMGVPRNIANTLRFAENIPATPTIIGAIDR